MKQHSGTGRATLTFFGCLLLSACEPPNTYQPPPPPTVTVSKPSQQKVVEYLEYTGVTEAVATVEVRARVRGFLKSVKFEEGDTVEKDDLLYVIDPSEYQANLDQATAAVEVANANLELAQATLDRMETALKTNAVSVIDKIESQAKRDAAKASLAASQAEQTNAQLDLGYTEIHAEIGGRIGRTLVDAGNLVGAGENTLLTTIVQMEPIYAYFHVSERDLLALMNRTKEEREPEDGRERLARLRKIPIEIGRASDEGYPIAGNIHYVAQGLDAGTGTFLIRGIFENPKPMKLLPGLFVRGRSPIGEPRDALLVSERAIGADQSGRFLLLVDDKNVVHHRSVVLGEKVGDLRVVESGLEPDDMVIVEGILRARPGAKVNPEQAPDETAAAPSRTAPSRTAPSRTAPSQRAPSQTVASTPSPSGSRD